MAKQIEFLKKDASEVHFIVTFKCIYIWPFRR